MSEYSLQAPRKLRIDASNLANQGICYVPERSQKFSSVELSDQRAFKRSRNTARELIYAAALGGRKAVADTSKSERMVANAADHVFGLP